MRAELLHVVSETPEPPEHLSTRAQELWRRIVALYVLELHHLELLRLSLESLDRCEEARRVLAEEGAYTRNRAGVPIPHPAVGVERDAGLRAARLLRELDLDAEVPADVRPPRGRRSR